LVLVGGVLFVTLHAVSDIGITGLLGAKLASARLGALEHAVAESRPRLLGPLTL
jgi:hypothetical protein